MLEKKALRIIKLPEVLLRIGISRSSIYNRINQGLFPRPVKLGPKSVGWVESEVHLLLRGMIAGQTEVELRSLVQFMERQRNSHI